MSLDEYIRRDPGSHSLWKKRRPSLFTLDIELTERCNHNCIHCYINRPENDSKARSRELTTEQWETILKQAADLGTLSVRFTGGEPLLREDFSILYRFTRQLGMKVKLFTSATLITDSLADMLSRIPPLEKIEVTVYGMKAKSYEAVTRTPGSFQHFTKGINLLLKNKISFVVKGVLLPANKAEIEEFETWSATLPGMNNPPSYSYLFDLRTRHDSKVKNRTISRYRPDPEKAVAFMARDKDHFVQDMKQFCTKFLGPPGTKLLDCGAGHTVSIDAYGMLQPCLLLRHPALVLDLKHLGLKEALKENLIRIKNARANQPLYLERCARCFLRGLCEQCPGKSWSENGTLDTPSDYLCQVAHAQARLLGLLENGEKAWEVKNWKKRVKKLEEL